ncbi:MAG: acetylglutamate kinase [Deltaproteobacteria bacterium]|nr:acetylglutamate kinase [Deltaproteobacteria bacterium]MBW2417376.1 acetylglutamate kinase [Deltaproteobacteria bacterium]
MEDLVDKAKILIEALPYMRRFVGKTIVIKYGGHAMTDEGLRKSFAVDVVLLKHIGVRPVIVHGGGPQIQTTLERMGLESTFVDGLRVTDDDTMEVVEMVLGGKINREIVELIHQGGGVAVGLTGSDGGLLRVRRKQVEGQDLGRVGEVVSVVPLVLNAVADAGFVPVVAPIGADDFGLTYNVNADEAAGAVARALRAEKLILLTDVEGVKDRHGKLHSQLSVSDVGKLIEEGTIREGMIPKVQCCTEALSSGVARTHIVDGRVLHAVLLEIFTDNAGVGTLLVP